jgi:hypothetical protein
MAEPTATEIENVRRETGLSTSDIVSLPDADIIYYWSHGGNEQIQFTAALCCEMAAARGGWRIGRWGADGENIDTTMQPPELRRRAAELRRAAETGRRHFGTVATLAHVINDDTAEEFGFGV